MKCKDSKANSLISEKTKPEDFLHKACVYVSKNVCWTILLSRQFKRAELYFSLSGTISEATCFKRGDGESLINYIMQQLLLLTQISCLSPSPSICASLQGDLVHNKIFMKPWTGGAIGPHKLVQTQCTQTHTYKHTIYTEHSLSTHMVTSSTEENYCYVSAASQKNNVNAESLLYKTTRWNKGLAYKRESNQTRATSGRKHCASHSEWKLTIIQPFFCSWVKPSFVGKKVSNKIWTKHNE